MRFFKKKDEDFEDIEVEVQEKEEKIKRSFVPSFNREKINTLLRNRLFLASLAVAISAALVFGGAFAMDKMLNSTVAVVKAKQEIPKGSYITADMLVVKDIGALGSPVDKIAEKDVALGKYAKVDILPDDIITSSRLADSIPHKDPYLYDMQEDEYAISVSIKTSAAGLNAKILPGDIVSVLSAQTSNSVNTVDIDMESLKYVEVLDVVYTGADGEKTLASGGNIILSANRQQAQALAQLEQTGSIHIAFVTRDKEDIQKLMGPQNTVPESLPEQLPETQPEIPSENAADINTEAKEENEIEY